MGPLRPISRMAEAVSPAQPKVLGACWPTSALLPEGISPGEQELHMLVGWFPVDPAEALSQADLGQLVTLPPVQPDTAAASQARSHVPLAKEEAGPRTF